MNFDTHYEVTATLHPNSKGSYDIKTESDTGNSRFVFTPSFVLDVAQYRKESALDMIQDKVTQPEKGDKEIMPEKCKLIHQAVPESGQDKVTQPEKVEMPEKLIHQAIPESGQDCMDSPLKDSPKLRQRSTSLQTQPTTVKSQGSISSSSKKYLKKQRRERRMSSRNLRGFICVHCGCKFKNLSGLKRHSIIQHKVCVYCDNTSVCSHWYVFDSPDVRTVTSLDPCGICHRNVGMEDQAVQCELKCFLWFHRECLDMTENDYAQLAVQDEVQWFCDRCRLQDTTLGEIDRPINDSQGGEQHMMSSHTSVVCNVCSEEYSDDVELTSHMVSCHDEENNDCFVCDNCGERFACEESINLHQIECLSQSNLIPGIRVKKVSDSSYSFTLGQHFNNGDANKFVSLRPGETISDEQDLLVSQSSLSPAKGSESDDCIILSPPKSKTKPVNKPEVMPPYQINSGILFERLLPSTLPDKSWDNPLRKVLSEYYQYASPYHQKLFENHIVNVYAKFELHKSDNFFPSFEMIRTMYNCDIHINLLYQLIKSWQSKFWKSTHFSVEIQGLIDFVSFNSVTKLSLLLASLAGKPRSPKIVTSQMQMQSFNTITQLDIDRIIAIELPSNTTSVQAPQIISVESILQDPNGSVQHPDPPSKTTPTLAECRPLQSEPDLLPERESVVDEADVRPIPCSSSTAPSSTAPSLRLKCPYCDVQRSDRETLKLHAHITHFICMKCNIQFQSYDLLQEHYIGCTNNTDKMNMKKSSLVCYECDAVFVSSKLLHKHRENCHKIKPRNLFESILQEEGLQAKAPFIKVPKIEDIYSTRSCFDITFKCSYCKRNYSDKMEFLNHLYRHHNVCSNCNTKFNDRFFLMRHSKLCGISSFKKSLKKCQKVDGSHVEDDSTRPMEEQHCDEKPEIGKERKPPERKLRTRKVKVFQEPDDDLLDLDDKLEHPDDELPDPVKGIKANKVERVEKSKTKQKKKMHRNVESNVTTDALHSSKRFSCRIMEKSKTSQQEMNQNVESIVGTDNSHFSERFCCPICFEYFTSLSNVRRHSRSCGV